MREFMSTSFTFGTQDCAAMFRWFQELLQGSANGDLSSLQVDLHSHLIPAIDDGVQSVDEAVYLIRELREQGIRKIITTPHVMSEGFTNNPEIIRDGLLKVKNELIAQKIDVSFEAAAEYYLDDNFEQRMQNEELLTLNGKYLMFEMSYMNKAPNLDEVLFQLSSSGYKPVMAHPERYSYYHDNDLQGYRDLRDKGVYLQMNMGSIIGGYSPEIRRVARHMLKEGLVDFLGTDLHNERHLDMINKCLQDHYFVKTMKDYPFKNQELLQ